MRLDRGLVRRVLHEAKGSVWADALDMRDGTRRIVRFGAPVEDGLVWEAEADGAWSPPITYSLADLLPPPGEPTLVEDIALSAAITAVLLAARAQGRLTHGEALTERLVYSSSCWWLIGRDTSAPGSARGDHAIAALLLTLDPEDPLRIGALLAEGAPVAPDRYLIGVLAEHLAHQRHLLAARAAAGRTNDTLTTLRVLAARLARTTPPPSFVAPHLDSSNGVVVGEGGVSIWREGVLDARRARAAARSLVGVPGAEPLRRWLAAMGRLRVDREILARR